MSFSIDTERIRELNNRENIPGRFVVYWMQQSQRGEYNHALEFAIETANALDLPVIVLFCLTQTYPEANLRHYTFMLEGLRHTQKELASRGIRMIVERGEIPQQVLRSAQGASCIVCDRGYLRHQRQWREQIARQASCRVVQVESDVVVPVDFVSEKAEYGARTLRTKINRCVQGFLRDMKPVPVKHPSLGIKITGIDLEDIDTVLSSLNPDRSVSPAGRFFRGGTPAAKEIFGGFLSCRLGRYERNSNQPQTEDISHMSPYLHFGQISPLYLALEVLKKREEFQADSAAYLEQLIVRRELAMNFTHFTPDYDSFTCLPQWARKTLLDHAFDKREHLYSTAELENARTHDLYWNAAMNEMRTTGFMHNYMRMYWGKKILEWSEGPEEAFETLLHLNNRYFLDGRDPNSYAGVAWIFGQHDRAWSRRPIFGKVRYMSASGLERKCDIRAYVSRVDRFRQMEAGAC
ncbi:MAG TPA: deoxyribodipyrimidine photo-lyase [Deltaproteobacteria bacterium]|nr:deoxyribodipyrimidine photo-lyase [Deltaproteobacteria bacterium]